MKLAPTFFALFASLSLGCTMQQEAVVDPNYQPPSGGAPPGTGPTPTTDPYATPVVCTSGTYWTRGDHGSALMHPGDACIDCHSNEREAPDLSIAGTLYPTAHEPSDCNGFNGSNEVVQILITDAAGKLLTLTANSAGNFYSRTRITPPYTAKVVRGDKTREMADHQDSGDCNSCHTEAGASSAPGRIMTP